MKLSDGKDLESGGLAGRLYRSVAPAGDSQRRTYVLLHGIGVSHRYFARLHRELALAGDVYTFEIPEQGHVFQHTAPGPAAAAIISWAPIRRRGQFPGA